MAASPDTAQSDRRAGRGTLVRIDGVTKRFGAFPAVERLSLSIEEGEFFALLGPSGCGKTTLLRMLAGFEQPDEGAIRLDGDDLTGIPPFRRPINMMFQSYALFPHLSVEGNIAFGLKRDGMARAAIADRVAEMLRLVRLEGFGARRPHQLSGGQRQRVALARALAKRPRLLLLDEPMAALDRKLREETRFELKEIQKALGLTFVIVTHDQEEALALADRIGVMEKGRLAQVDGPTAIYERPRTRYVANFIGDINILDCVVEGVSQNLVAVRRNPGGERILLAIADSERQTLESMCQPGAALAVALRPERLRMTAAGGAAVPERMTGAVAETAYLGSHSAYRVALDGGGTLRVSIPNAGEAGQTFARGERVVMTVPADAGVVLRG